MAHEVESMVYVREVPWHGLGVRVEEAMNSREALQLAGLDWNVSTASVYAHIDDLNDNHQQIEAKGFSAMVRDSDNSVLGIMTTKYRPVQNREAFAFTDALLGRSENFEVKYETAGSLRHGRRIFMLARLDPAIEVVGDKVCPYLVFTNSFDGTTGVRVAITPVRVVCQNTLTMALEGAVRSWSAMHVGNIMSKMQEAAKTLELTEAYLERLPETAEEMVAKSLYPEDVKELIEGLFPDPKDPDSKVAVANVEYMRETLWKTHDTTKDIKKFKDTAWGWYNSVSDMVTHMEPLRKTSRYKESLFEKSVDGHPILAQAQKILAKIEA